MTSVVKNCHACGELFSTRLAAHKRGWGLACGKSCAAAYKYGQRPRDVNAEHAKHSPWAAERWATLSAKYPGAKPPKAPSIKEQVGKVKIKPVYHSPSHCRHCGKSINGPGLCSWCEEEEDGLSAMEAGWDGHKIWTSGG